MASLRSLPKRPAWAAARTGDAAWSEIQFAGRHGALRKAGAPSDGSAVVAIAFQGRLPVAALEAVFAASA
jgi:hypothetical protein